MIVISDPLARRGGGQVVLEELLRQFSLDNTPPALIMPTAGQSTITIPENVRRFATRDEFAEWSSNNPITHIALVSNATRGYPRDLQLARKLRREGSTVSTIAIMHNYPGTIAKETLVRACLREFDHKITVEPGLVKLASDAIVAPWLAPVGTAPIDDILPEETIHRTGFIKAFARPDPSKGLHLLSRVFPVLESHGYRCEVALGDALEAKIHYESRLRTKLAPWLVDGYRTSNWVQPGDVVIVPSISGETSCLAAQESLLRGAYVLASRVGLLPYLCASGGAYSTFPTGDTASMIAAANSILDLAPTKFDSALRNSAREIASRSGNWYTFAVTRINQIHDAMPTV